MKLPRVIGRWRDGTFYVDDLSRVQKYDEVFLIDLREHDYLLEEAKRKARAEAEIEYGERLQDQLRRKYEIWRERYERDIQTEKERRKHLEMRHEQLCKLVAAQQVLQSPAPIIILSEAARKDDAKGGGGDER